MREGPDEVLGQANAGNRHTPRHGRPLVLCFPRAVVCSLSCVNPHDRGLLRIFQSRSARCLHLSQEQVCKTHEAFLPKYGLGGHASNGSSWIGNCVS